MPKRERLEDLGRIQERMREVLEREDIFSRIHPFLECESKHSVDTFLSKYKNEEKLHDLHDWIRWLRVKLEEIDCIARGLDDE